MPHRNDDSIVRFYDAFARLDGAAMADCYAPGAHFEDPVFTDLNGDEPGAMWRMLTGRAKDLSVRLQSHDADEHEGSAHWLADYTFSTGRRVHNDVRATFRFDAAGRIAEHRDEFAFHAGRGRRSARPACCSAGLRCCAPRSAARRAPSSTTSVEQRPGIEALDRDDPHAGERDGERADVVLEVEDLEPAQGRRARR